MKHDFKWALITGASSGIGKELSFLAANNGINLILHGRDLTKLEDIEKELRSKVQIKIVVADLKEKAKRQELIEIIRSLSPELVINNAGFGLYGDALSYKIQDQMEILEVNGAALLELTLEASRILISKGKKGIISNIASAAAFPIFPGLAVYAATKAFVVSLSESLDEETRPHGVRVLAACPGMVSTGFRKRAGDLEEEGSGTLSMTAAFAAKEIWRQIEKEKKVCIFNWRYQIMIFLVRYLLPKKWVSKTLKEDIDKRRPSQPLN